MIRCSPTTKEAPQFIRKWLLIWMAQLLNASNPPAHFDIQSYQSAAAPMFTNTTIADVFMIRGYKKF